MFFSRKTQKSKISIFKYFENYTKQGNKQTEAISLLQKKKIKITSFYWNFVSTLGT